MNTPRALLPHQLPVLTEVVELPPGMPERSAESSGPTDGGPAADLPPSGSEGELISRVMRELELQVDLMLETRLREILTPAIARATDQLMRETREDLAAMLGEILSRAVVQELSRPRSR